MSAICDWIQDQGGSTGLTVPLIFQLIDSFLSQELMQGYAFIPTIGEILGTIDYYLGFDSGLCDFTIKEIEIINLQFPENVQIGIAFDINYDIINNGAPCEIYTVVIDEFHQRPLPFTYITDIITTQKHITHHIDIYSDLYASIRVGKL